MEILRQAAETVKETGFGSNVYEPNQRLMNKDGSSNVLRGGLPFYQTLSFYHALINMSWLRFTLLVVGTYLVVNLLFAFIYVWVGISELGGVVSTTETGHFWE